MATIDAYLKLMVEREASDLFLSPGSPPYLRIDGATHMLREQKLASGEVKPLVYEIMSEQQRAQFEAELESNFACSVEGLGRFRLNVYHQRGEVAVVARHIKLSIPDFAQLGLPTEVADIVMQKRGLILVVGGAGSGKSTSLAAMVDYRADHADEHVLTIEDPIEYLFPQRRSLIDQREVGIDTLSFGDALRNAMRESPDVIMIGEIRDMETAHHAIAYAEAGHLCLSTMHANNANQAIDRMINFFPENAHRQLLLDLSLNLEGVISQRLVHGMDGKRVLAVEVLRRTAYISEMIREGHLNEIKREMEKGSETGIKTFDQSLFDLYLAGRISREVALENADSRTDLSLRMRLSEHQPSTGLGAAEGAGEAEQKHNPYERMRRPL
jgi:twitching motility protein PilU